MARSVEEIQEQILTKKASYSELDRLDSTSRVAIWRLWVYIVAFCFMTIEKLFDTHKAEVEDKIRQLMPHTARWYRNKALDFQYGFDLLTDSDIFDNADYDTQEIQASKIIKYAAVVEASHESRLIVKIATETNQELSPIPSIQQEAFTAYLNEIKDAGVRITVINYLPDLLRLQLRIYRDPLVLDEQGVHRVNGNKPVEDAIEQYMKQLPFNGELLLQELANKIEVAQGVRVVHIDAAQTAWLEPGIGYGNYQNIDVKQIPVSGYYALENYQGISYVV